MVRYDRPLDLAQKKVFGIDDHRNQLSDIFPGDDILTGIPIEPVFARAQCEHLSKGQRCQAFGWSDRPEARHT